ncbi:MAG TPA: hypothetical protein VF221_05850 [Chloroflexota bacterium]
MESNGEVNARLFWMSIALSTAGLVTRFYARPRAGRKWWYIFPWLLANGALWFVTTFLRGVVLGLVGAVFIVPYLLVKRRHGGWRDDFATPPEA